MDISPDFHLTISVPSKNASLVDIESFWRKLGFQLIQSENRLTGWRGSMFGNMTSFNMRKLIAKIEITKLESHIKCDLYVCSAFQKITDWNIAMFQLELIEFRRYLLGESISLYGEEFRMLNKKSLLKWTLTLGCLGNSLSDDGKRKLLLSNDGLELPKYVELKKNNDFFIRERKMVILIASLLLICVFLLICSISTFKITF